MRRGAALAVTLTFIVLMAVPVVAADLTLAPDNAEGGSFISVSGTGYTPGLYCDLHFNTGSTPTDSASQVGGCTVDPGGGLTGSFTVPFVAAGSYTVWVCNANGGGTPCDNPNVERASAPFALTSPPTTTTTRVPTTTTTVTTASTTTIAPPTTSSTTTTSSATTSVPFSPSSTTTTPRRVQPVGPGSTTTAPVAVLTPLAKSPTTWGPPTTVAEAGPPPAVGPSLIEVELVALGLPAASGAVVLLAGSRVLRWLRSRRLPYGWFRRPPSA